MMRQYEAAKKKAGDALLFFRMGDFYELFFDDARSAAQALGLTLTARDKAKTVAAETAMRPNAVHSGANDSSANLIATWLPPRTAPTANAAAAERQLSERGGGGGWVMRRSGIPGRFYRISPSPRPP